MIWGGAETSSWRRKLGSRLAKGESQGDKLEIWSLLYASVALLRMKSWWTIWDVLRSQPSPKGKDRFPSALPPLSCLVAFAFPVLLSSLG